MSVSSNSSSSRSNDLTRSPGAPSISRRMARAKRRSRSSCSISSSRSSASSSSRSTSALRVTRKGWISSITIPSKRSCRLWRMICSTCMKRQGPSPQGGSGVPGLCKRTQRGRTLGTLSRANWGAPSMSPGRRSITPSEVLRLEMKGNGWPGSTARGVSTANSAERKYWRANSRSRSVTSSQRSRWISCAASAGRITRVKQSAWISVISITRRRICTNCSRAGSGRRACASLRRRRPAA